ncbi:riboflavin synthase subunit alpha [Balneatrix alpica]|uniref:riboflavin synthase subunit alpha n=1 Tax=Balneatrix alpica TaxID=75684 RepID=UPI002738A6FE|nr:riboflavin synthase subunit alpha [Balneatrix alpica]
MFTGIVQGQAQVVSRQARNDFCTLRFRFPAGACQGLQAGASVAFNGTCLTVTEVAGDEASFDLIQSTLALTNLGELREGDFANFERAARIGDEVGGHQTSGHIHDCALISAIERSSDNCKMSFKVPPAYRKYLMDKGYIALNGCSLTIAGLTAEGFYIYLIPETLNVTTFGRSQVGDRVNLEIDPHTQAIVDTVERYLARRAD